MQTIRIFETYETLSEGTALFISEVAKSSVAERGKFTIALSGGGTPNRLFEILASDKYKNEAFWKETIVFWGDERYVAQDSKENNSYVAENLMLQFLPIPAQNIYKVNTSLPPAEAAADYNDKLRSVFGKETPAFDVNLLGVGENGHTASLFPHTDILNETEATVKAVYVEEIKKNRISFTAPLINASKEILFLISGDEKAPILEKIIEGKFQPQQLPAQLIKGLNNNLFFYLDKAAAACLKNLSV